MEEEKLNNLIYLLRTHHIDSEPLENLIKRNKELEEMLKHRIKYTDELEKDLFENASNYVIQKSKVREKIEELNDLNSKFSQRVIKGKEFYLTELVQNILQELLQEGDK